MKTTVEVSDYLYRQAKAEAALQGRKLKDLVEEGLRLVLEAPVVASYLLSMAATRTSDVAGDRHIRSVTLKHIRSVTLKNAQGDETDDDIIFEIELFTKRRWIRLASPSVSTVRVETGLLRFTPTFSKMSGGRSAARERFGRSGSGTPRRIRVRRRRPLLGARRRDRLFRQLLDPPHPAERVYGTGLLPDSKFQGYLVPDAYWEIQ
jgi:hypothetical protein